MSEPLAEVEIVAATDASAVARIIGEVDLSNADAIAAQLDQLADGADALTVDLTGVAYFDSQGVRIIQSLVDRHLIGELDLTLVAGPAGVAFQLLTIAGIANAVPVRPPSAAAGPAGESAPACP